MRPISKTYKYPRRTETEPPTSHNARTPTYFGRAMHHAQLGEPLLMHPTARGEEVSDHCSADRDGVADVRGHPQR
jgi:hypothetical protein